MAEHGPPDRAGAGNAQAHPEHHASRPAEEGHRHGGAEPADHRLDHHRIKGGLYGGHGELADELPATAMDQLGQNQQHRNQHQGWHQHPERRCRT